MGKTRRTYRDALLDERQNWDQTRRWLRKQHQPQWDHMWTHAENHADAIGEANPRSPIMGAMMGICLGQQREIATLRKKNSGPEASLSELRGAIERLEEATAGE